MPLMFEQLATRLNSAGVLACVAPPNQDSVVFAAARFFPIDASHAESSSTIELFGIRFPIERWNRQELEDFSDVIPIDYGTDVLLADRIEIIESNGSFVFHNNPITLFGGCNPMFVRHKADSPTDIGEITWNYYFGSPLSLNNEWTVPINWFPEWDPIKLTSMFESCRTIGLKSWLAVERDSVLRFRPFPSQHHPNRQLLIREDGSKCYVVDRKIDEWLIWAKQKGLEYH